MGLKVVKFGGSSVADGGQIRKVEAILDQDPDRRFVVVSAPGKRGAGDVKVTDMLYACRDLAAKGEDFSEAFAGIERRFRDIEEDLGVDAGLQPEFDEIRRELKKGCTADYAASRGEHLNAVLIAAYLGVPFLETAGRILFDQEGKLLAEETDQALKAALPKEGRAVIPGFYGSEEDGTIRVFSRGGSDITGALVAQAAGAEVYENWTDVSGLLVTDPRIVPEAQTVPELTYDELRALSFMGAGVLHEDAVFPVRAAGIPINIRNTNRPQDDGTMILPRRDGEDGMITGISGKKGYGLLTLSRPQMNGVKGFSAAFLTFLEERGLAAEHLLTGVDRMAAVVKADLSDADGEALAKAAAAALSADCAWQGGLALLAVVGKDFTIRAGNPAAFLTAMDRADAPAVFTDLGCDPDCVIAGVREKDYETAVRALYRTFM